MKSFCISFALVLIIIVTIISGAFSTDNKTHTEYLRIHIRADSNEQKAQAVKYKVKDAVVEFLTPYIAECDTKEKAEKTITELLPNIQSVADKVLQKQGFTYKSTAEINNENFPTRIYGDFTLEQGYYDALIVKLGSGEGDNWWCVVYPPLCFTGSGTNYVYKSKIAEIIKKFT